MPKNNEPIRIAMIMGKMIGGGVESVVMNYYRSIDKKKYQFDFIVDKDSTNIPIEEISNFGGNVYFIEPYQKTSQYVKGLNEIFKNNTYKIIHSHINSLSIIPLYVAKKNSIPIRIAHNHSTAAPGEFKKNILKNTLKLFSTRYATHYMSPTIDTGVWLFGEKKRNEIFILKNALNLSNFEYNECARKKMRKKLQIEKKFVVGFFGRMVWQKNPLFFLDIIEECKKSQIKEIKFLIIGDGPLKQEMICYIKEHNLNDLVVFLENKSDIYKYYQAIDLLVFPSNYEGLGMVSIEAQVSGLPVLNSEQVPKEVKISEDCYFLPIDGVGKWVKKIEEISTKKNIRKSNLVSAKRYGYNIEKQSKELEKYYDKLLEVEK